MKVLLAHDPNVNEPLPIADLQRAGFPRDCELLVVCVADVIVPPPSDSGAAGAPPPARVQAAIDKAERAAGEARTQLQAAFPTWKVTAAAVADEPAWGIVRKAGEWPADLIVVGAHQHSAIARLTLGSVSQRVLHDAPCSVRIVKRGTVDSIHPPRLLIGIDGSDGANAALAAVAARQWAGGTAVRVISVADASDNAGATELVRPVAQRLADRGLTTTVDVLEGDAQDTLQNEAERWNADCIFIGARGLSAVERILLGSVSGTLAARATCSVEVVRPRG